MEFPLRDRGRYKEHHPLKFRKVRQSHAGEGVHPIQRGCDADPNDELWDEQIYEVILAENPDSIYGYSFERATCLESNHHEPEVKLSDLTGHYLLNPGV